MQANRRKGLILRIAIIWLCIFSLVGFLIATKSEAGSVTMSVIPEVPKTGEAIVVTFNIGNPSAVLSNTDYQLYVNGELVESGRAVIAPQASTKHQYAYANTLERGEQVNFVLETSSDSDSLTRIVSLPAYPPQLLSSFVSFAAFSTSVMSSMMSMEYFSDNFGNTESLNLGILVSIILIVLLVFLELTQAMTTAEGVTTLSKYRVGFKIISAVLFAILIGMVFTKVVMILVA